MKGCLLQVILLSLCVSTSVSASNSRFDQKLNSEVQLNNEVEDVLRTTETVEMMVETTANIIHAALANDLQVTSKVNKANKKLIDLVITWTPPKSGKQPDSYNLHVVPLNETHPACTTDSYYAFINDPLAECWKVPPEPIPGAYHEGIQIISHCSYRVSLESNPHNGRSLLTTIYTVPECVEGLCSCLHANQLPQPEVRATMITKDTLNVTWIVRPSKYLVNITKFVIGFGKPILHSGHHRVYNMSWVAEAKFKQNQYFYSQLYVLPSSGEYMVGVYSLDGRGCSGPVGNYTLTVSEPTEQTLGMFSKTEMFWMVLLPSVSFILAMCVAVSILGQRLVSCFKTRNLHNDIGMTAIHHNHLHKATYKPVSITCKRTTKPNFPLHQERNVLYVEKEIEDARAKGEADSYEIGYSRLTFGREIGKGAFGRVFLAEAEAIAGIPGFMTVAVKKLKNRVTTDELEEFQAEISMMKRVGRHGNIVTMLGCCTLKQPYCMVMEYVPCGDLLQYLRRLRVEYSTKRRSRGYSEDTATDSSYITPDTAHTVTTSLSSGPPSVSSSSDWLSNKPNPICSHFVQQIEYVLDPRELQSFATQIARGMAYLEGKQITHRDLAARNILIDGKKTLKISDFGLSRSGIYVNTKKKKVPLRWLSVEAMRDSLYSSKSDVWAFGIVLWEIGTLGGFPYPTVADYDLLNFLLQGKRLEKPDNFSPDLYSLMTVCWSHSADDRPSFADIVAYLDQKHRQQVYVDFSELKPDHQFPPTEQMSKINKKL